MSEIQAIERKNISALHFFLVETFKTSSVYSLPIHFERFSGPSVRSFRKKLSGSVHFLKKIGSARFGFKSGNNNFHFTTTFFFVASVNLQPAAFQRENTPIWRTNFFYLVNFHPSMVISNCQWGIDYSLKFTEFDYRCFTFCKLKL